MIQSLICNVGVIIASSESHVSHNSLAFPNPGEPLWVRDGIPRCTTPYDPLHESLHFLLAAEWGKWFWEMWFKILHNDALILHTTVRVSRCNLSFCVAFSKQSWQIFFSPQPDPDSNSSLCLISCLWSKHIATHEHGNKLVFNRMEGGQWGGESSLGNEMQKPNILEEQNTFLETVFSESPSLLLEDAWCHFKRWSFVTCL